ncbi:MAG: diaminopimelate epimerase [Proteobacteria bacterium]|nr:diaminopimelate epimerase [Pseudomonadota bacterium]
MDQIIFYKMSGSGNDFIIIDNRNRVVDENDLQDFIAKVCRRKMSVGADGFILVEESENVDFKWRFFNSDGSQPEMCGNGARCVARFAYLNGIAGSKMSFETIAGIVSAEVKNDRVKIKMTDPADLKVNYTLELENGPLSLSSVNTGVPHVVVTADNLDDVEVVRLGREIRFHDSYAPAGTNVNFICAGNDNTISIRTYERGVEDETLACGTGSVAAAVVMHYKSKEKSPVRVITRGGGCLYIYFEEDNGKFYNVFLEGDARVIYKGYLGEDALKV